MGWKSSTIIIASKKEVNELELLNNLGFDNLIEIERAPFEVAINPDDGKIYIGKYKGNLLICAQNLPMTFLEETVSLGEKIISKYFPETEICSLVLHSGVNLWGYSLSKDTKKIRVRAGTSDKGTMIEYGEPLEQELNLLSKSKVGENGERIYYLDDFPDKPLDEDQVGENFVFELANRYIGQNLDMADDLLFETELKGYKFSNSIASNKRHLTHKEKSNKWFKYVLIFVIIIIWQILKRTILND